MVRSLAEALHELTTGHLIQRMLQAPKACVTNAFVHKLH